MFILTTMLLGPELLQESSVKRGDKPSALQRKTESKLDTKPDNELQATPGTGKDHPVIFKQNSLGTGSHSSRSPTLAGYSMCSG